MRSLLRVVFTTILLTSAATLARAHLVIDSVVNTPTAYEAVLTWSAGGNTVAEILSGADLTGDINWQLSVVASQLASIDVTFAGHLVAPHVGEPAPNPLTMAVGLFPVQPGVGSASGTSSVPHGSDLDTLLVEIAPISSISSQITISATHAPVPEPSSIALLAAAFAGVAFSARRRLKPRG